ncbi:MAG: hypothetical protein HUU50_10285 [Candidatus Brocadiae bacterium]|nr:hypothetical protein [Candidatus Brocadiia bacterium]
MLKNKALAVVLPILAIALIGFIVMNYVMPAKVDLTVKCSNSDCKKEVEAFKAAPGGPWPMACPECKQKTLVRAEVYNDGKKEYILTDEEKDKMSEKTALMNGKLGQ